MCWHGVTFCAQYVALSLRVLLATTQVPSLCFANTDTLTRFERLLLQKQIIFQWGDDNYSLPKACGNRIDKGMSNGKWLEKSMTCSSRAWGVWLVCWFTLGSMCQLTPVTAGQPAVCSPAALVAAQVLCVTSCAYCSMRLIVLWLLGAAKILSHAFSCFPCGCFWQHYCCC